MTDEDENLTPARPVAPRRRLSPNPQMAQPIRRPPASPPATSPPSVPAPEPEPVELEQEPLALVSEPDPEPQPVAIAAPMPEVEPEPALPPVAVTPTPAEPEPVAQVEEQQFDFPRTIKDTLRKVDDSFSAFRAAAMRFPSERMDERIAEDSWTRKQMLQHVASWHDLTADRLIKLINTGKPAPLDRDTDQFNASVARQAIGKTSGEILKDIDATFNRLRRQLARMTDAQLEQDDWWAAWVIGGNTYGHYEEHWADVYTPDLPQGGGRSRR